MSTKQTDQPLALGQSHAEAHCSPERLLADVDPLLLARKGWLYLPCSAQVNEEPLRAVVAAFYGDTSFDVVPSVAQALKTAYAAQPNLAQLLPLAVVVQGSEVYGIGSAYANLWLVHRDQARALLAPWQDAAGDSWLVGRWRLLVNDTLVLGDAHLSERVGANRLHKLGTARRPLDEIAAAIAKAAAPSRAERPAVMVLRVPGFAPVAGFAAEAPIAHRATEAPLRDNSQRSPIVTALLLAMILVGASLAISRPELSKESALSLVAWMLTPVPTETPAPTATPSLPAEMPPEYQTAVAQATELAVERAVPLGTRSTALGNTPRPTAAPSEPESTTPSVTPTPTRGEYPLPRLISPSRDQRVDPTYLTLQWEWDGELGEDEYFDVRLWIMGGEKRGIAWTKQSQYIQRATNSGWHSWTVVVVRGRDGIVQQELTQEPAPINFNWSVRGKDQVQPLPTRIAPNALPTRVPPTND